MATIDTARIADKLKYNQNRILRQIGWEGRVGRLSLAKQLRMSNSRVCELIPKMMDEELLIEELSGNDRRGRRSVPVMLNPNYGHLAGFDMEASRLRFVVVDFQGKVVWQSDERLPPIKKRDSLIKRMMQFINTCTKEVKPQFNNLMGIGLAPGGLIHIERGTIERYELLEAARNIPLRDLVEESTQLPAVMEDNIRALTLAEWTSGAARGYRNFICLGIRSGIGAGIFLDGRLYRGNRGFAGEAGSMVLPQSRSITKWRSLQQVASEQALGLNANRAQKGLSPEQAESLGQLLGSQLASMISLLDPQAIILAGRLLRPEEPLWEHIEKTIRRFVLPEIARDIEIRPAQLGPFGAAVGAAYRCFQILYPIEPADTNETVSTR